MPTQSNFTGGRSRGLDWGTFFEGLHHGRPASYFLLFGLIAIATIALWAGNGTKGPKRRIRDEASLR